MPFGIMPAEVRQDRPFKQIVIFPAGWSILNQIGDTVQPIDLSPLRIQSRLRLCNCGLEDTTLTVVCPHQPS
jgi:hypothetical protein